MNYRMTQRGFSLVELSIVILIMGLLLGGLMMPLSVQRENARLRDGAEQLETIVRLGAGHGPRTVTHDGGAATEATAQRVRSWRRSASPTAPVRA